MTGAVVRTAVWSLPLVAGCPSDGEAGEDTTADDGADSTTADDGADSTTVDDGADSTTVDDGADSTTVDDGVSTTVDDGVDSTTVDDGADSSTTADDGNDTLVEGCWDRDFVEDYYYAADGEPSWEPFTCSLPVPCEALEVYFNAREMTPDEIAAADASARCMLEALRDGTAAHHSLHLSENAGQYDYRLHYFVLPDGVVGSLDYEADLSAGARETYRGTRNDAFFAACLAETELEPLVGCLVGGGHFPALDLDLCIDAEPVCPE